MTVFAYVRQNIDGPPRAGVAAIKRIRLHRGSFIGGFVSGMIALAALDLGARLLITAAHGQQIIEVPPCAMPNGQAVDCQHFLSSNPDAMRVRNWWTSTHTARHGNRPRGASHSKH